MQGRNRESQSMKRHQNVIFMRGRETEKWTESGQENEEMQKQRNGKTERQLRRRDIKKER